MIIWLILLIAAVAADQITKAFTVANIAPGESVTLIENVFRFTYIRNEGAAFGMLSEHRWVFLVLSTAAILGIIVYVILTKPKNRLLMASLTLIAAGGIGNMIDRIRLGYVIDFIDFCAFPKLWMWIFNVADACVCIGAGLMVLYLILEIVREKRAAKEGKNVEGEDGADTVSDASSDAPADAGPDAPSEDGEPARKDPDDER